MEIKTTSINLIATATEGGKDVLVVGLKDAYRSKPQYQRYLRREFERGKDLDNASIFKYISIDESEDHGLCIKTEWEDSRTLAEWLQEGHSDDEKKRVARKVAQAVGYMHSQGFIFGCLNCRNIFLTRRDDAVKILTVALRYADSMSQPLETLKYVAPEAKDGTVGLDARADIYSLGVMLKDMGLGAELHTVVEHCCRFGRNERFESVDEFLDASDKRHYTRSNDELTNDAPTISSNKKMAVIVAIIVVLVGVAIAIFVAQSNSDDTQAQAPAQQEQPAESTTADSDTTSTASEQPDMDSTQKTQPQTQPQGTTTGQTFTGDDAYLNDLVPQMQADLDKIYNSGADAATIRKKVATYYKGLRRVLKKQGKNNEQLTAFDKAFADYTQQKNQ